MKALQITRNTVKITWSPASRKITRKDRKPKIILTINEIFDKFTYIKKCITTLCFMLRIRKFSHMRGCTALGCVLSRARILAWAENLAWRKAFAAAIDGQHGADAIAPAARRMNNNDALLAFVELALAAVPLKFCATPRSSAVRVLHVAVADRYAPSCRWNGHVGRKKTHRMRRRARRPCPSQTRLCRPTGAARPTHHRGSALALVGHAFSPPARRRQQQHQLGHTVRGHKRHVRLHA